MGTTCHWANLIRGALSCLSFRGYLSVRFTELKPHPKEVKYTTFSRSYTPVPDSVLGTPLLLISPGLETYMPMSNGYSVFCLMFGNISETNYLKMSKDLRAMGAARSLLNIHTELPGKFS